MKKAIYCLASLLLCALGFAACDTKDEATAAPQPPKLISIIPKAGCTGSSAIISGVNFSPNADDNEVTINGKKAEVNVAAHNRLAITLPDNPDGAYTVKVKVKGHEIEGLKFTYAPGYKPELSVLQVMPSFAYVGEEVKIIGQCFSTVPSDNKVTINGAQAVVKEAKEGVLTIVVPDTKEGTYPVSVTVGGKTATGSSFTYGHIVRLTAETITPDKGKSGDEVVITGEAFGKTVDDPKVTVNGKSAKVKAVTPTSLTVEMPDNAPGTYPVVITVGESTVSNLSFTYVAEGWSVKTYAGDGTKADVDGSLTTASFMSPQGICFAPDGTMYVCSQNGHKLRRISPAGEVSTITVSGATLSAPWGVAVEKSGSLILVSKGNSLVLRIDAQGNATEITDGGAWKSPMGVKIDAAGNIYVADRDNKAVRRIATDGSVKLYDMSDLTQGPCDIAVDSKGNIFAVNGGSYKVFMFTPDGTRTDILGLGTAPTAATWTDGEAGNPLTATMGQSFGINISDDGKLYISDLKAFVVREVEPAAGGDYTKATVRTIAGTPFTQGAADGLGTVASFKALGGVAIRAGKIYVADNGGNTIRVISK